MNMHKRLVALVVGVLLVVLIGYGSYEFVSFESLKNACVAKEIEKAKVVNVYYEAGANESLLPPLIAQLHLMGNVEKITTISSEEALVDFKQRNADDSLTLQALEELGTNPLGPTLSITFEDLNEYAGNEKALMAEIEARSSAQGLPPSNVTLRVSNPLVMNLKKTSFLEEVFGGFYVSKKELLKDCEKEPA